MSETGAPSETATPPRRGASTRKGQALPAQLVEQVSDHFNVMQLIDEPPTPSSKGDVQRKKRADSTTAADDMDDMDTWQQQQQQQQSSSLGSSAGSLPMNNGSESLHVDTQPLTGDDAFGSPLSADDLACTPRTAAERAKNRRWTVNVPSVSHLDGGDSFASGSHGGSGNFLGLLLPPLSELSHSNGGISAADPASELQAVHAEEERLHARLAALRERKERVFHGDGSSAALGPPPSPPPSPPQQRRRMSAFDVGAARARPASTRPWQTPPLGPLSLPPPASAAAAAAAASATSMAAGESGSGDEEGNSSEFGVAGGRERGQTLTQLQQRREREQLGARSRRHTIAVHSADAPVPGLWTMEPEDEEAVDGAPEMSPSLSTQQHLQQQHHQQQYSYYQQLYSKGLDSEYDAHALPLQQQQQQQMHPAFMHGGYPYYPGAPPPQQQQQQQQHSHPSFYYQSPPPQHGSHGPPPFFGAPLPPPSFILGAPPPPPHMAQHPPLGYGPRMPVPQKQATGPPGANIFVFNFPRAFDDEDLRVAFAQFGVIVSATVFIDKVTGKSKCFGFVSYEHAESAQAAIARMNGAVLGGKPIKVEIKRERGSHHQQRQQQQQQQHYLSSPQQDIGHGAPAQVGAV